MSREYTIKEAGYVFMYVSNENATLVDVYFDDVVMTHTKGNVVQYNEYYPFGLQTANSWTRENTTGNNFLGNGGTELNTTSNLYDLAFRNYDPILGRMNQIDPMATKYASLTPYNFSFNDPVTFTDPSGADPFDNCSVCNPSYTLESSRFGNNVGYKNDIIMDPGGRSNGGIINWSYAPSFGQLQHAAAASANPQALMQQYGLQYGKSYSYQKFGSIDAGGFVSDQYDWVMNPPGDPRTQQTQGGSPSATYTFEFVDKLEVDGKRTLGSTELNFARSNYGNGSITFHFNVKFDNVLFTEKFVKKNGTDYWRAVVAHERGHVQQFMDLAKNANSTLFSSGLTGDAFEMLFQNIMDTTRDDWFEMNENDAGHSDANQRARSFLAPQYWHYLSTPPRY